MVPEEVVEKYDREMDRRTRQNLERFAEFMARMIEKYGHKVLAEMVFPFLSAFISKIITSRNLDQTITKAEN